jgi:hypothetical protein
MIFFILLSCAQQPLQLPSAIFPERGFLGRRQASTYGGHWYDADSTQCPLLSSAVQATNPVALPPMPPPPAMMQVLQPPSAMTQPLQSGLA